MESSGPLFKKVSRIPGYLIWAGQNKKRPAYIKYAFPVILIGLVTLIKLLFSHVIGSNSPYLLYFAIVSLSAILGGVGPSVLAAILSAVVAEYYFVLPFSPDGLGRDDIIKVIIFLFQCAWLILLSSLIITAYGEVRRNRKIFKAMIEKGSDAIILTNREGKRVYVSPTIDRVIGYTHAEFMKLNRWSLGHPDDLPAIRATIEELRVHPGKSATIIHRAKHKGGEWIWLQNTITNLLDENAVQSLVMNLHDVTERVLLEQKKDDFISIASHELKTPITSLKASMQLLDRMKDNPSPAMFPKLVAQSNKSVDKIMSLVDDLLNAGRVNQKELVLNKTTFTIAELLAVCCNHVRMAGKHDLILRGDEELQVFADEGRIDQVVVNLVNNAVKYAPESKNIYLIVEKMGDVAKISVKDTGPGIAPEKLPHLFDRYYRAEHNGYHSSGLGLGLYIAAEIVKRHAGQIGVESKLGQGSTFWFTLPIAS